MNHTVRPALIGVFDSGVGGLSVLRALHQRRPDCSLLYLADSGHAPYGERDVAHVVERSLKITRHLVDQGAHMVVVACNTATAAAIEAMREHFPWLALVGVEPGVKPAALMSRNKRIGVMATPSTLSSPRFATLVERHAPGCQVVAMPCPGLAAAIERGDAADDEINALLDRYCGPLKDARVDTVVLGCTHYPFVADRISLRLGPGVTLLDTAEAVARHALNLHGSAIPDSRPEVRLQTTGDTEVLERLAQRGLGLVTPAVQIKV
jgi:glutamate racemase